MFDLVRQRTTTMAPPFVLTANGVSGEGFVDFAARYAVDAPIFVGLQGFDVDGVPVAQRAVGVGKLLPDGTLTMTAWTTPSSPVAFSCDHIVVVDVMSVEALKTLAVAAVREPDGSLLLPVITPTVPSSGAKLFGRNVAGRMLPAVVGPAGLETSLQPLLARNKIGLWSALGNVAGTTPISAFGLAAPTATGTGTVRNVDAATLLGSTKRIGYVSPVGGASTATIRLGVAQFSRKYGFFSVHRFAASDAVLVSTARAFFGLRDRVVLQSDQTPFGFINTLGVAQDVADANWFWCHNDGTGTGVKVDTGIAVDNTSLLELAIFAAPGASDVIMQFTNLSTGQTAIYVASVDVPADTQLLTTNNFRATGTNTTDAVALDFVSWYIETDF